MVTIIKAGMKDVSLMVLLGNQSFRESHGHSASPADIDYYTSHAFNDTVLEGELADPKNIYHIIYHDNKAAGYSKIILNSPHIELPLTNITKLERLYLLESHHGKNLGTALFAFNLDLSVKNNQSGMWLYTWKENNRGIAFYKKQGFAVAGSYNFNLSPTHANPNHLMFLQY